MARRSRARAPFPDPTDGPHPPLILELFVILFSAICLILACAYMSQIWHARVTSFPPVSWAQSGAGSLYWLPPSFTFIISCFNMHAYRHYPMPLVYGLGFSCIMCAGWITVIAWWFQCHIDTWIIEERFCYQRSLWPGIGKQYYRGVDEGLADGILAFAILILLVYILYAIIAGFDFRKYRKGRYRESSGQHDGYQSGNGTAGGGGGGEGCYSVGMVSSYLSGDGGGGGGGDGGGGGGGGGGVGTEVEEVMVVVVVTEEVEVDIRVPIRSLLNAMNSNAFRTTSVRLLHL